MKRNQRSGCKAGRGATLGPALLCLCLSVLCSFALGLALTCESNRTLLKRQVVIEQQNVLPVPGASWNQELRSVRTAACAALFYAFSLGLGLPALLLPSLYFFRGPGTRNSVKWLLLLSIVLLLGFSLVHRAHGFRDSLFVLGTACWVYIWLFRSGSNNMVKSKEIVRALPVFGGAVLLLVFVLYGAGIRGFASVRDAFLVSNTWGRWVNDFYYRYTLMAAEPIKPPARKTQPLCMASKAQFEDPEWRLMKRSLNEIGVILADLPMEGRENIGDWIVTKTHPYLTVTKPGARESERLEMNRISFLPKVLLDEKWGAYGDGFRFWIGSSLFVGIPCALLGGAAFLLTKLIRILARMSGRADSAAWRAVLPVGAALWAAFHLLFPFPTAEKDLTRIALSEQGWIQVRAVRSLAGKSGAGLSDSETLLRLLNDADTRIRYWAAQMARGSEGKPVMNRLIANLSDSSVHVASASARGLKRFHSPEVFRALRLAYQTRTEWYLRDAVYRGLGSHVGSYPSEGG